jgi:spore maturation protein CgeB
MPSTGEDHQLKILIYGEPYDWAMAWNVVKACKDLGYDARIFDYTQWLYRTKKVSIVNRILDRLLFVLVAARINRALLKAIEEGGYDILLVLKGIHVFPSTISRAKGYVAHAVNWNPDDFFNPLNNSRYLLAAFSRYDCIFTPRRHLIEEYLRKGAKRVELLDWYYLPEVQQPSRLSEPERKKFGSDIAFVGTWSPRREALLAELGMFDLRVWGSYWHRASKEFRNAIDCRGPVFGAEMCKIISASKININILTAENRDTTNVRNLEIPACGGFQLCERSTEVSRLFEEGKEIVYFESPAELLQACKKYLGDERAREQIARQGYERLMRGQNTMKDRVKSIVSALYANKSGGPPRIA